MKFEIKQGDESLTSHSGLALVGMLLNKTDILYRLDNVYLKNHPRPEISHGQIAYSMIGMLSLGKTDFEDIEVFRNDEFFHQSLDLSKVPSEVTLRQRLDSAAGAFDRILKEESAEMIKRHAPHLTPGQSHEIV